MPIRFKCACGKSYKVDDKFAGKRTKCTACGASILIPLSTPPAAPPPPTEPAVPPQVEPPLAEPAARKGLELSLEVEPPAPKPARPELAEEIPLAAAGKPPAQSEPAPEPRLLAEATAAQQPPAGGEEIPLGAAQKAPEPAKKCPKCGAGAEASAAICIECGASFAPAAAAAARKQPGVVGFLKRNMLIIALAAGGLVLLGGFIGGVAYLLRSRRPKPPPSAAAPPAAATPATPVAPAGPPSALPPGPQAKPPEAPPPAIKVEWNGFRNPRLIARDRLAAAGDALLAAMQKSGKPPAALAELGLPPDRQAGLGYVGPEIAALSRFRPLLFEEAENSGRRYVFFSDGLTRLLTAAEWRSALPVRSAQEYLTPVDQELLAATAPRVRISNDRYARLEVSLDGAKVASLARGDSRSLDLPEGEHQLKLVVPDGPNETIALSAVRGLNTSYFLPLHADTIYVPARAYRAVLTQQGGTSGYVAEKEGNTLVALRGPAERVVFSTPGARGALSQDLRTLEARIERDYGTIEGLDGKALRLDELSRLEEGVVNFKSGSVVTYRRSGLGTLAVQVAPNLMAASLVQGATSVSALGGFENPSRAMRPGMPPGAMPPRMPPGATPPRMPSRAMPPGMGGLLAATADLELKYPPGAFVTTPDLAALGGLIHSGGVAQLILERERDLQKPAGGIEGAPISAPNAGMLPPARSLAPPPAMGMPGAGAGERLSQPVALFTLTAAQEGLARAPSDQTLFAGLALYGGPESVAMMLPMAEKLSAAAPGYNEMLLALARCGKGAALAQLAAAGQNAPVGATIALSLIDDDAARNACGKVMADWSASNVQEAVNAWPRIAGPSARRNFILALAAAQPALLEDVSVLNALMKLDPYALEPVLAQRIPDLQKPAEPVKTAEGSGGAPAPSAPPRGPGMTRESRQGSGSGAEPLVPPSWQLLAHRQNTQAVARFVGLLTAADAKTKQQAVAALAEASDDSLVALLGALLREPDTTIRIEAARALARLGSAEAVALLTDKMTPELMSEEIVQAAPVMAARAGREATSRLLAGMLKLALPKPQATPEAGAPPPPGAPPGPPGAGRPPERMPPRPPDMGRSPERMALPGMGQPATTTSLVAQLLNALAQVGVPTETRGLIEETTKDSDASVRMAAHRALAVPAGGGNLLRGVGKLLRISGPGGAPSGAGAVVMMKDSDAAVRASAIRTLGSSGNPTAFETLLAASKDPDAGVRLAAMRAAGRLSGSSPALKEAIAAGLADADPRVADAAAEAAIAKNDPSLGQAVVAALNRPTQEAKTEGTQGGQQDGKEDAQALALITLARAAAQLKAPGASGALVLLLAHNQPEVKAAAATALGELRDAATVPSLVSASRSEDASVAAAAVVALTQFESPGAVQAILAALQKETLPEAARRAVLMRVVAAAGKPGPFADWVASGQAGQADMTLVAQIAPGAPEALQPGLIAIAKRCLQDPRPEVRRPAAAILGGFSNDPAVRAVIMAALDQDASGVAGPAADIVRQNKDPALMATQTTRLYRQLVEAASVSTGMTPGAAGTAPATPGAAPAARGSGLAKASPEENMQLRLAIIESVFNCQSGDDAARTLRNILAMESDEVMRRRLIDALARTGSPVAVGYVAELAGRAGTAVAPYAVETLGRIGTVNRAATEEALQRLSKAVASDPELAAAAQDALDALTEKPQPAG